MKRVHQLTKEETQALENEFKNSEKHHFRIRCQTILLSNKDVSVAEISRLLERSKNNIYTLINTYDSNGIEGLKNKSGQGIKATLSSLSKEDKITLKKAVDNEPQNLNKVCALLSQKFGFKISKWMLIQYLKKN